MARSRGTPAPSRKPGMTIEDALATLDRKPKIQIERLFRPADPPPGVLPKDVAPIAMDSALVMAQSSWAVQGLGRQFVEGMVFPGYPYLAELSQRSEYQTLVKTIAREMTRKWGVFKCSGKGIKDQQDQRKAAKLKALSDEWDRLKVRSAFRRLAELDGIFGRAHLFPDFGTFDNDEENQTPLGDGTDETSRMKIGRGSLKRLKVIEPLWTYPYDYDTMNPLSPSFYRPGSWYVMGKRMDASRLMTFVGNEVPDIIKPAYSFGGIGLVQQAQPYVENWLKTRDACVRMVQKYAVWTMKTNMSDVMTGGPITELSKRIALFVYNATNDGVMALDKDTEDFANVSAPLAGLHELQAQALEHLSSVSQVPLVKWTGISPSGLNASSEGEIAVFYDFIHSRQEEFYDDPVERLLNFTQLSLYGEIDPEITFEWSPLQEETAIEKANRRKAEADTDQVLIDSGVVWQEEARKRHSDDPDDPYHGIDPEHVPDLQSEEAAGLEPVGGKPQGGAGAGAQSPYQALGEHYAPEEASGPYQSLAEHYAPDEHDKSVYDVLV